MTASKGSTTADTQCRSLPCHEITHFCYVVRTTVQLSRGMKAAQKLRLQQNRVQMTCTSIPSCDLLHRISAHQRSQRPPQQGMDSLCQMVKQLHLPKMLQRGIATVLWKTGRALLVPCLLKVPPLGLRGSTVLADSSEHESICC